MEAALDEDITRVESSHSIDQASVTEEIEVEIRDQADGRVERYTTRPDAPVHSAIREALSLPDCCSLGVTFGTDTIEDDGSCFEANGVDDGGRLLVTVTMRHMELEYGRSVKLLTGGAAIEDPGVEPLCQRVFSSFDDGTPVFVKTTTRGGGLMVSASPLGCAGDVSFEVEVGYILREDKHQNVARMNEGIEIGVTTEMGVQREDYAVLYQNSWVSADDGGLWSNGGSCRRNEDVKKHWATTKPSQLVSGDVVRCEVKANGLMVVTVNGGQEAAWPLNTVGLPLDVPLYALIGMRNPCAAVSARYV